MEYFIGVDVGGSKILTILVSFDGEITILDREEIPTRGKNNNEEDIIARLESSIDVLLLRQHLECSSLSGIGIVLPGPIDKKSGKVIECPNIPELNGMDIRQFFEKKYGVPVGIDNDAHAATLAEARSGAGSGFKDFIYICIGTGIGCGIIINGELYKGADGMAGELSHIVFPELGCLYKLASGGFLKKKYSMGAEDLRRCCENRDPIALEAFDQLVRFIGTGIATVITLFNPEAVVIGGGMSKLGDFLLNPLEEEARRTAFSVSGKTVSFFKAAFSTDAGVIGAVYVCQDWIRDKN